jgi:hypothetical protein
MQYIITNTIGLYVSSYENNHFSLTHRRSKAQRYKDFSTAYEHMHQLQARELRLIGWEVIIDKEGEEIGE